VWCVALLSPLTFATTCNDFVTVTASTADLEAGVSWAAGAAGAAGATQPTTRRNCPFRAVRAWNRCRGTGGDHGVELAGEQAEFKDGKVEEVNVRENREACTTA
jgi:hypothetical protein